MEGQGILHEGEAMTTITRRAEFSASHYYHNPDLSPEENRRIFGKCNNPNGHGHNYVLEVTVAGPINPVTGMVGDLKELKHVIEQEVVQVLDHKLLNKEVPGFAAKLPTPENLAVVIWGLLAPKLKFGALHQIRLYENPDLYVDYFGE